MRLASIVVLYGILSLFSQPPVAAGGGAPSGIPAEGRPERVMVDVFVGDAEGLPLRGLSAEDFQVLEDGQPVAVSSFYAVENGLPRDQGKGGPQGSEASPENTVRLVLMVDQLSLQPEQRTQALRHLSELASQGMQPGDQAMLASFDGGIHIEQRFTASAERIRDALLELAATGQPRHGSAASERDGILRDLAASATPSISPADTVEEQALNAVASRAHALLQRIEHYTQRHAGNAFRTLDTLQGFFSTLAGVSGQKRVVLVSNTLALQPGEALFRAWERQFSFLAEQRLAVVEDPSVRRALRLYFSRARAVNATVRETGSYNAARAFRRLGAEASSQRITFYALHPGDVVADPSPVDGKARGHGADGTLLLDELAKATGGFVAKAPQSLGEGFGRLLRDLRDHYTLGFLPRPSKSSSGHRQLVVRVKVASGEVRHRAQHAYRDAMQSMEDRTLATLVHETMHNPLGVTVDLATVTLDANGHQRLPILVKIPMANLVLSPVNEHFEGRVSIHVGARGPSGRPSAIESVEVDIRIPKHHLEETEGRASVFGHRMTLEMNPGKHMLAVGVRDELGDTEATTLIAQPESGDPTLDKTYR